MSKSKSIVTALVIIIILGGAASYYIFWSPKNKEMTSNSLTGGRAVFLLKDSFEAIEGVSSVLMTINSIEVHNNKDGWKTIFNSPKSYDTLVLRKTKTVELLADVDLPLGAYDEVRLAVSRVDVMSNNKVHQAKLPSSVLGLKGKFEVSPENATAVIFDVDSLNSLHLTEDGKYVALPVLKWEARSNAIIKTNSARNIEVIGGKIEIEKKQGTDEKGELRENFMLQESIEIDEKNEIRIKARRENGSKERNEVSVIIKEEGGSGISGSAKLESVGNKTRVTVSLGRASAISKPAGPVHFHLGSCLTTGDIMYPLNKVVAGKSVTTLNAALAEIIIRRPISINFHEAGKELDTFQACGNIQQ